MEHIEEGTIHAWLDDALASDEAARVEQHVRECAECAAAVAEARGLIAASTRILSALDDVPAGVVPRRVEGTDAKDLAVAVGTPADVSAEQAKGAGAAPVRRHRPWWQRPQFAAAAGIAFVAVALSVVWQRSPQRTVSDFAREVASEPAAAPVVAPSPAPPTDAPASAAAIPSADVAPNANAVTTSSDAAGVAAAKGVAPTARESKAASRPPAGAAADGPARPLADGGRAKRAADNEALAYAKTRARSAADLASSNAPPPPAARAAEAVAPPVTTQKAAPPAPAAVAQPSPTDSLAARRKLALNADNITRAEQARVRGEREMRLQEVVTTGASVAMEARRDFMSVDGIVGCYRLQRRVPALDAGVPELIELQGTERGAFEGDVLRVARLFGVDATRGTEWRWSLSERGDVSLVRVQGAAYARFPLALRVAAQTGETSIATRVTCPAR